MPLRSEPDAEGRPRWVSQKRTVPANWKAAWPLARVRDLRDQRTGADIARVLHFQTQHVLWLRLEWRALCELERSQSTTPEPDALKGEVQLDPQTLTDQSVERCRPPRDLSHHGICPLKMDRVLGAEFLELVAGK